MRWDLVGADNGEGVQGLLGAQRAVCRPGAGAGSREQPVGALGHRPYPWHAQSLCASPRSFSIEDQRVATLFVAQGAVTLANAQAFADRTRLSEQLRQAIHSRTVVDQAIGVIMARRRIGAEEALRMLRTASNNLNKKLREVTQSLLDSVSCPDNPKA